MFHRVAKQKDVYIPSLRQNKLGGCQVIVSGEKRTGNWMALIDALQSKQGYRIMTIFSGALLNHNCATKQVIAIVQQYVWRKAFSI